MVVWWLALLPHYKRVPGSDPFCVEFASSCILCGFSLGIPATSTVQKHAFYVKC